MKKSFFFAIVALGMIVACRKEVQVQGPEIDDNAPVAVQFNVNAPTITVTKTKAAVDQWDDTKIYIYSGVQTESTSTGNDGTSTTKYISFASPLIENAAATVAQDGTVTFDGDISYYYDVDSVYDFYAYYIDNATINPTKPEPDPDNSLSATVTIDGSQDIMVATTDHNKDMANATEPLNSNYIYSAYAARRGVHPTLNFKHMLSRFEFRVKQGNNPNSGTSKGVVVTGISIESYTQGTLTIAPTPSFAPITTTTDAGADGDDTPSTVADDDNTTSTDTRVPISNDVTETNPVDPTKKEESKDYVSGGSDLMVFPGDATLELKVTLAPEDGNLNVTVDPMTVALDAAEITKKTGATFEAGKKYIVTITVYNLEQISVTADLAAWEDGGKTTYDPDDKYDEEITPYFTSLTNGTKLYHFVQNLVVGALVYTDEKFENKANAGDYTDADGRIITVDKDGRVESITYYTATKTLTTDDDGAEVEVETPLYHAETKIAAGVKVFTDKSHETAAEDGTYYDSAKVYTVLDGKVSVVRDYYKTVAKKASNSNTVTLFHETENIETGTTLYTGINFDNVVGNDTYIVGNKQYTVEGGTVTTVSDENPDDNQ